MGVECRTPAILQEVKSKLKEMEEKGIIRPSTSPYASQMVVVRKKSGQLRICVDFRALNKVTIDDAFPLPRINEVIDSLKGARYFSTLDLASGYYQLRIAEQDKHKTAFSTPYGLFEWERVPMGLKTSGACFSRLLSHIFQEDLFDEMVTYLDDILVYSDTFDSHVKKLDLILTKLSKNNLKLRYEKCSFFKTSVNYLGHYLTKDGVTVDPQKYEVITSWKEPETVKDLKSFLGFASFYRRFIKGFATIVAPLNNLLLKTDLKSKEKNAKVNVLSLIHI